MRPCKIFKHEIYCGDNRKILPLLKNSVDLMVTSPPYDNLRTYKNDLAAKDCDWNWNVFKGVASAAADALKQGGIIVWVIRDQIINGSHSGTSFKQALHFKEIGLNIHDVMIWDKNSFRYPDPNRYPIVFEYMFIYSKGKPRVANLIKDREKTVKGGMRTEKYIKEKNGEVTYKRANLAYLKKKASERYALRFNIWRVVCQVAGKTLKVRQEHPAAFPEQLAADHITSWSNKGDVVCDPFLGSGTTGVAAMKLGRKFIGIEINKRYFDGAVKRLKATPCAS